ncbi:leucine-rich repeat protein [Kordia sp. YSTF-M3]|uniref:Leucine-rich repeat protein n=1 Tax=Kordia aestuariivivens TaxID=2759037 RepID=A0ABR7QGL8_9FLAO|nr:leucine-rich repeat domain-containing protein [Kordia aestuariivivens]MBC8757444.1 leucine-rich repeat protein [Kordia aestuariivivens]
MKTKLTILIANLFCIIGIAQTFSVDGFNYNVISTSPNEVEVTGGTFTNPLTIPSTVTDGTDNYTVTAVGSQAFRNKGVTSVILPNTLRVINFRGFRDNGGLTSVTLPASITNVGGEAFLNGGLTEIIAEGTIPASISNSSFGTRTNVDLIVPNGLEATYISGGWTGFNTVNGEIPVGGTFDVGDLRYRVISQNPLEVEVAGRLNSIVDVVIPASVLEPQLGDTYTVTAIGSRAFRNAGINSVVFSNTINTIKNEAFEINNLTTVTLPASLITIGNEVFNLNPLTEVISQAVTAPAIQSNSIVNRGNISLTIPSGSEAAYVNDGWTGFFSINGTPFIGSDFSADGFNYRINGVNPNTVELRGGGSGITDLVLQPTTTKNGVLFTVNAITNRAFRNRGINSVVLPSTIETIGFEVFELNNLTTITLPASVTTIADQAFNLNPLTEVISQAVVAPTIETNSFINRGNISLTVPSGSEASYVNGGWTGFFSINGTPFIGADFSVDGFNYRINGVNPNTVELRGGGTGIVDLVLPSTTTKNSISFTVSAIGFQSFRNKGVNSVVFPQNIEVIGAEAFELNNLTTITIPASVTTIGEEAFLNNSLTQVIFTSGPETIGVNAFRGNQLINVNIPSGTVTIGNGAFINNQISSLVIPTGVITIGRGAFRNNNLVTVVLPTTVETIDTDAFLDNQLVNITLPTNLTTLGAGAFRNNQLTSIVIPDGVTELKSQTFRNNDLESVTLPANLQIINNDVFRDNEITSIDFPASLTTLGGFSFRNNKLTSVTIPANISTIEVNTFNENLLTSITIPSNITSIENSAFANNPLVFVIADSATPATITSSSFGTRSTINLTIIPDQQTVIDDYIAAAWTGFGSVNGDFQVGARFTEGDLRYEVTAISPNTVKVLDRQTAAQNISIPAVVLETNSITSFNVTLIEDAAFQNTDITSVAIGGNIVSIGNNAFQGSSLTSVNAQGTMPATITASSFGDRSVINLTVLFGLETTYENAGWTGFFSVNGIVSDGAIGVTFGADGITYEITSVNPNEVEVIGGSVTGDLIIPAQANLNTTNFSVKTIRASAFQNDPITSVTLPASITDIGANAFTTTSLTEVTAFGATPATIETNSFGETGGIDLTIPVSSETDYENAGWTGFFSVNGGDPAIGTQFTVNAIRYEILTLAPNTLSAVGKNGTVPNGDFIFPELISKNGVDFTITTIGNSAFRSQDVQTVSLPSTVTTLAFRAFRSNGSLRSTNIPANITSIGGESFFGNGLTEVIAESVNPPTINNGVFNPRSDINLFIPQGTTQAYIDAGWTGFGAMIEQGTLVLEPKVYLQGASLNPNTGEETLMRDDLRIENLIPTTSPYPDGATSDSAVFNATGNNAIVDWVFVELRDASNNTTIVEGKSALLQRDGDVVDTNGTSVVQFTSPLGNYFVVIKHRNHLGIMTGNVVSLTGIRNTVDFTDATSQITFGSNAQTIAGMPVDTVGMWTGNVNGDNIVQYSGTDPDAPAILSLVLNDVGNFLNFSTFIVSGYDTNDVDMDGRVQYEGVAPDAPFILQNILAHPGNFLNFSTFQIQEQLPEN